MTAGTPKQEAIKELVNPSFSEDEKIAFLEYAEFYSDFLPIPAEPISGELQEVFCRSIAAGAEREAAKAALYYFLSGMPPKTAQAIKEAVEKGQPAELLTTMDGQTTIFEFLPPVPENRSTAKAELGETVTQAIADTLRSYEALPTAPSLYFFNEFITANGKQREIKTTAGNRKVTDRHKAITYQPEQDGFTVTQSGRNDTISITIENADKITGKGVKKCYAFLLAQCNKQNFKPVIGFSLQDIVDRGMYKSLDTARTGIKSALDTLQKIKFSGTIKKGKKTVVQAEAGILFYHYKIKNNYVEVSVNENFNIEFVAAYFAMIPLFAYGLDNTNAFDITQYIFTLARQNTATIKEKGCFTISFKALQNLLALPTEADIAPGKKFKPKQYVIDPILKAIADIEEAARAAGNEDFTITAVYDPNYSNYRDFLEGYLQISFRGEIFANLCAIADKQEARIEEAKERRAKRLIEGEEMPPKTTRKKSKKA